MSSLALDSGDDCLLPQADADLSAQHRLVTRLIELAAEVAGVVPGVVAGSDPEALHAMRVALRRMAALARLRPDANGRTALHRCRRQFAEVVRLGGPRRDLDIAIERLRESGDRAGDAVAVERLVRELDRRRLGEQRRLCRRLASRKFRDRLDEWPSLMRGADAPVSGWSGATVTAGQRIETMCRQVRRGLGRIDHKSRFRQLHGLRKDVRTLRYLLELAAVGDRADRLEAFVRELRRAQDALGEICDLRAQRAIFKRVAASAKDRGVCELASRLARRLARRERRARRGCSGCFDRLLALDPPR